MRSRSESNNLSFIYMAMSPEATNAVLLSKIDSLTPDKLAALKAERCAKVWLLRESRQDGLLTFHSASWNEADLQWKCADPQRIALTNQGWVSANLTANAFTQLLQNLTKFELADYEAHAAQLLIDLETRFHVHIQNCMNPETVERSSNNLYSSYSLPAENIEQIKRQKVKTEVELPDDILTAITCPLTKKTFKEAVVSLRDIPQQNVHRGVSYERNKLEEIKLEENSDFIPNHKLNLLVNYLGAQNKKIEKLQKIADHEIKDAIDFDKINNAVITPAGQTYSRHSIIQVIDHAGARAKDPINPNVPITVASLAPNLNIDIFISGWERYFIERTNESKSENPSPRPTR